MVIVHSGVLSVTADHPSGLKCLDVIVGVDFQVKTHFPVSSLTWGGLLTSPHAAIACSLVICVSIASCQ